VGSTTLKRQLWVLQEGGALPPHETRNTELAEALAELNRVVITEMTLDDLLAQVLVLARSTVSGTDGASVSLTRDGTYCTSNATDDVVRELDAVQYENDDGPCVEAMRSAQQVSISLLRESDRFAPFSAAALGRFMSSVLSTPFLVQGRPIGALNLYSASVSAFGSGEAEVASLFAEQASSLLANASAFAMTSQSNANLERALQSRDVIGQAKGILMEREGSSADEAFDMLRRESQRRNEKVIDIARKLVEGRMTLSGQEDRHGEPDGN
jgi:GAF domain-containing protein